MDFLATMPILNLVILLVFIIIFIILMSHLLKGKDIRWGKASITEKQKITETRASEREIIKRQIHIARAVCINFKNLVPNKDNYDDHKIENICYKVADEIEDFILFNHLSNDDEYINSRFPIIWAVIDKNLGENFSVDDKKDLESISYDNFKKLIKILLAVRQERE